MTPVSAHRHTRLFVIRHADAGIRRDGPGDRLRSLVPEGRDRAQVIADPADVAAMLHLLRSLPDGSVACTHGEMLADLMDGLVDARLWRNHPIATDKGVVWVLSRTAGSLSLIDEISVAAGRAGRCRREPDSSATPERTGQDDRRSMVHG